MKRAISLLSLALTLLSCSAIPPPPPPAAIVRPAPVQGQTREEMVMRRVFYATDRNRTGARAPAEPFGGDGTGQLSYGTIDVAIPAAHRRGDHRERRWWMLEYKADPARELVLLPCDPRERPDCGEQDEATFYRTLHGYFDKSLVPGGVKPARRAFVFIHGFNVSFEHAIKRTAQISVDVQFPGAAIAYSWPSRGEALGYWKDEKSVIASIPHLERFLADVARRSGATTIHVMAHSMGNRALLGALERLAHPRAQGTAGRFGQVMMAAPDVEAVEFGRRAAAIANTGMARNYTLYASSGDHLLKLSKELHRFDAFKNWPALEAFAAENPGRLMPGDAPRAGDTSPWPVISPPIQTIDVSMVAHDLLGHSYYANNPSILNDVGLLLATGAPPDRRDRLKPCGNPKYWLLLTDPTSNQACPHLPRIAESVGTR